MNLLVFSLAILSCWPPTTLFKIKWVSTLAQLELFLEADLVAISLALAEIALSTSKCEMIQWICVISWIWLDVKESRDKISDDLHLQHAFCKLNIGVEVLDLYLGSVQSVPEISKNFKVNRNTAGWCRRMMAIWCCLPFVKEERKGHQWRQVTDTSSTSILSVRSMCNTRSPPGL